MSFSTLLRYICLFALKEQKNREKAMGKTNNHGKLRDDTARIVARIHGVSVRYVQLVREGKRDNDDILATLVDYQLGKSKLIKHLEELVPLTPNPEKYACKKN